MYTYYRIKQNIFIEHKFMKILYYTILWFEWKNNLYQISYLLINIKGHKDIFNNFKNRRYYITEFFLKVLISKFLLNSDL